MNYLKWKKETRKIYNEIEKKLKIDNLHVTLPKKHQIGVHIIPRLQQLVIPFEHMNYIKKENQCLISILDITEIFIYHELGHYFQYIHDKENNLLRKKERNQLLIRGLEQSNEYTIEQRTTFLKTHNQLTLKHEKEAWEIGLTYLNGNIKLYKRLEHQSLETYVKSIDFYFELFKPKTTDDNPLFLST